MCNEFQAKEVILYGSRAKGTARERSDIDIAVSGVNDFEKVVKQLEMWVCHLGQVRAPYTNAEVQTQCQALLQIEPPGTLIRPLYLYKCKVEIL